MKKKYLVILPGVLLFLLVFYARVSASPAVQETMTPFPSITPLPPTVTVTPSPTIIPASSNCAGSALPSGWLTLTPSYLWLDQCGGCLSALTPSPSPTLPSVCGTPIVTGTPPVTPLPTVCSTVTVTPTPTAAGATPTHVVTSHYFDTVTVSVFSQGWAALESHSETCSPSGGSLRYLLCEGVVTGYKTNAGASGSLKAQVSFVARGASGTYYARGWVEGLSTLKGRISSTYYTLPGNLGGATLSRSVGQGGSFVIEVAPVSDSAPLNSRQDFTWWMTIDTAAYTFPSTPSPSPTPTISATNQPGLYCSSVNNTNTALTDDFGFSMFEPDGDMTCGGWDDTTIGTEVLPAFHPCFQPSRFGVVKLFGISVELGTLAVVAAAAWIWRFLRTS